MFPAIPEAVTAGLRETGIPASGSSVPDGFYPDVIRSRSGKRT